MSIYVDIEKKLGDFELRVKFEGADEVVALLGASGCGKSMTLKCIAGVEKPDRGRIVVNGKTFFDSEKRINLPPQQRHTALMFQNFALFPNMTVRQNIMLGANAEKDRKKRAEMADSMIETFRLNGLEKHLPRQLSGGQQQRTALARALISSPDILLMDEPFSALDSHLRFMLEQELREVFKSFKKTVIFVSHNRDEVYRLCDKIAVMVDGSIDSFGTREEVFANPVTRAAAILTGCKNISPIVKLDDEHVEATEWGLRLKIKARDEGYIGIRMHDISPEGEDNRFLFEISEILENPFSYTMMLKPAGADCQSCLGWKCSKTRWKKIEAETIELSLSSDKLILLK